MVLLRHGISSISPEIHEPQLLRCCALACSCTRMNNNMVSIHPLHHPVTVEVETPAQSSPLTNKFRKSVVYGIAHYPAHIVLFDVATTASSAQHHQKEVHVNSAVS